MHESLRDIPHSNHDPCFSNNSVQLLIFLTRHRVKMHMYSVTQACNTRFLGDRSRKIPNSKHIGTPVGLQDLLIQLNKMLSQNKNVSKNKEYGLMQITIVKIKKPYQLHCVCMCVLVCVYVCMLCVGRKQEYRVQRTNLGSQSPPLTPCFCSRYSHAFAVVITRLVALELPGNISSLPLISYNNGEITDAQ